MVGSLDTTLFVAQGCLQYAANSIVFSTLILKDGDFTTDSQMTDHIIHEICEGIGDSGVRCGVIGEVGCSWPLTDSERRSLQAAALAQRQTGNTVYN